MVDQCPWNRTKRALTVLQVHEPSVKFNVTDGVVVKGTLDCLDMLDWGSVSLRCCLIKRIYCAFDQQGVYPEG